MGTDTNMFKHMLYIIYAAIATVDIYLIDFSILKQEPQEVQNVDQATSQTYFR